MLRLPPKSTRTDPLVPDTTLFLSSDCFEVTPVDHDKAIAGFLELRDGVGTDARDPLAHGTGFDRIGSFSEGYEAGPERCAEYPSLFESGELVIVEVPFTDQADFERGGDLPLEEAFPLAIQDLEPFWSLLMPELGQPWTTGTDEVRSETK